MKRHFLKQTVNEANCEYIAFRATDSKEPMDGFYHFDIACLGNDKTETRVGKVFILLPNHFKAFSTMRDSPTTSLKKNEDMIINLINQYEPYKYMVKNNQ